MNGRVNLTEHIGLQEVGLLFLRELGWVYRPQPTADVGMDALVEEALDGNPTGRFMMIQVKSGKGNVTETATGFTYYMSKIHRDYYSKVEMPVVFVLYLPDERIAQWASVNQATIEPTQTQWKLSIPRVQLLNAGSKPDLLGILDDFYFRNASSRGSSSHVRDLAELVEDFSKMGEARIHLDNISSAQMAFTAKLRRVTKDLRRYNAMRLTAKSREIVGALEKANSLLQNLARELNDNISLYTEAFTKSGSALEVILQRFSHEHKLVIELPSVLVTIRGLRGALDGAILEVDGLLHEAEGLTTTFPNFKSGRAKAISAIDNLALELRDSRSLLTRLILLIESRLGG